MECLGQQPLTTSFDTKFIRGLWIMELMAFCMGSVLRDIIRISKSNEAKSRRLVANASGNIFYSAGIKLRNILHSKKRNNSGRINSTMSCFVF